MNVRRIVSTLIVGLSILAVAAPASAQQQQGRGRGRGGNELSLLRLPAPLAEKLALTADQKSKLEALGQKVRADQEAIRASAGGDRQAAAQKSRELQMKSNTEALAILTGDQKKSWEGWAAEHQEISGLGRSATALLMVPGLSAEQKGKLKTLATDTQAKRRELFQGAQGNNDGVREKMTALDKDTQTAIKAVLNADQGKQFDTALASLPEQRRRPNP